MIKRPATKKKILPPLILILLVQLVLFFNIKFTAWPEMTFWPYLILKGWFPYKDIAIAHTPLLLVDLTIFYKLFGVGILQLKIYTWTLILLTDVLLFGIVKEIWNKRTAVLSLLFYIPIQIFYNGNGLWFDLALAPIALVIFYLLRKKNYLWAGIFWVLAFLVKQTAFWFLIPIGLTLIENNFKKNIKGFLTGAVILLAPSVLIVWLLGIFPDFVFWAFKFGIGILPRAQGQISLPSLRQVIVSFLPFSILAFIPFMKKKKENFILFVWCVAGIMGAFPRWELFHFQPALPFLVIVLGSSFLRIKKIKPFLRLALFIYLPLNIVLISRYVLHEWGGETRFFDSGVKKISNYIKENAGVGDRIYLLNTWDNVYMLSNTLPAVRPWIPHLLWYMELPGIQENMVSDLDNAKPKMIVQKEYNKEGLGSYRPELISDYISENYKLGDKVGAYLIYFPKK